MLKRAIALLAFIAAVNAGVLAMLGSTSPNSTIEGLGAADEDVGTPGQESDSGHVSYHSLPTLISQGPLKVAADIAVNNPFDRPIEIAKVGASCGCTSPIVADSRLNIGEDSRMHVEIVFPPHGGQRRVSVTLELVDGSRLIYVIDAAAYPSIAVESESGVLNLGRLQVGKGRTSQLKLLLRAPPGAQQLPRIVSIQCDPSTLHCDLPDDVLPVSHTSAAGCIGGSAVATLNLKPQAQPGRSQAAINVTYEDSAGECKQMTFPIAWYVESSYSVTPERTFVTLTPDTTDGSLEKSAVISRADGQPFAIDSVTSTADWLLVRSGDDRRAKSPSHRVSFDIACSELRESAYAELRIGTDVKEEPTVTIPTSVFIPKID